MKILFIGINLNREDIIRSVEPACAEADCFFLENFYKNEVSNSIAHKLGKVLFWKNFSDAFHLLNDVKPDKIIFVLIDNYYHFSILYAAKQALNIQVWYMDHGIRFEHELKNGEDVEASIPQSFIKRVAGKKVKIVAAYLKNSFFRKTKSKLPKDQQQAIQKVFNARSKSTSGQFMRECGYLLQPDGFIIYSEETFAFYKILFQLSPDYEDTHPVVYVGIPSLDNLFWLKNYKPEKINNIDSLLLIDQALHEQSILGWTEEKKIEFITNLIKRLANYGMKLIIKPHPWSDNYYAKIRHIKDCNFSTITDINPSSIATVGIVASFNSTLLLGFVASSFFKVICFEMHPQIIDPTFCYAICKYQTAEEIDSFEKLDLAIENFKTASNPQLQEQKDIFIKKVMYKFDANSKARLNDAVLLSVEIVK